ncbi:MAG TPA: hypothetical protein DDZ84_10855 [Firmicutes bacterium]|jgi:hypothetical protein|nr:hypothetical protein [Bacillota bacterium]
MDFVVDGERVHRSTGKTNKDEAAAVEAAAKGIIHIPNRVCSRSGLLSLLYPRTTLAGKGDSVSLIRSRD